ncbi:MAG: protein translocase subunit SecD [Desulfovibrio sp.]|jgi:preprotein translocase subunit SecD|nr:protein translocase subunit SecD [Desulfovibrio sp.]
MALRWRLGISLLVLGVSLIFALPNMPGIPGLLEKALPQGKIALGLDLKGGIHLTLGVETDKALTNALFLAGQDLRRMAQEEKIVILRPRVMGGENLEFTLPRAEDEPKFKELFSKHFSQLGLGEPQRGEAGQLRYVARFTPDEIVRLESMTLDQALRTIRNRIDQFGVAEPDIRKQTGNRIQVQLPGISDPRRAVELLKQTAHLEFHLVREDVDPGKAVLPAGVIVLPLLEKSSVSGQENAEKRIALEKDVMLTGEDVADARPSFDRMNQAYVMLNFNSRGGRVFEQITGENVGRGMAIVLDGKVYSAPVIRERIGGGRASISGSFTTAEAQDLAIVLRAGSLPAPVTVLEERSVGPSLGQESIDSGVRAALVGAVSVAGFMAIYYGFSGLIAVTMLSFTLIMIVAGLTGFGATLTLPGIAGIVLTIGMAVDANVLIFERIREELRLGLTPFAAVKVGFERAAISITDSNLTTMLAAVILYQFGTGPIRGFAVTLALGIAASMFTAIFVSRAIFEEWARHRGTKGLSI